MLKNDEKIEKAWEYVWEKLFYPGTNLIYDFRTSFDEDGLIKNLPTLEEVNRNIPNPCGWGTGMEDSMIGGPLMLDAVIYRYEVTKDECLREYADKLLEGIRLCATVSEERGFLARSVSPFDGKSHYINSSRDQYTHVIYALFHYWNSPMMKESDREWITDVLVSFAERAEKNARKENNDYDLLREDGKRSMVCKMWGEGVWAHEIHRLPMFYLAAWYVSRDEHWFDMYKIFRDEANNSMDKLHPHTEVYAFLQMQVSLRLLYDADPDKEYKEKYLELLNFCADKVQNLSIDFSQWNYDEVNRPFSNWREMPATNESGITLDGYLYYVPRYKQWKAAMGTREISEAIFIQLLCPGREIPQSQIDEMLKTFDYFNKDTIATNSYLYPIPAYWALRAAGIL